MKKITVFTPTFNRAHLLPRLYESLCNQTSQDFKWLIIDDGSSDNTDVLVNEWQIENRIEIQYQYKKNGGMHTGHNLAYQLIETELNVCIDSDDMMPNNAIQLIVELWDNTTNKSNIAGIIGLDAGTDNQIIGTKIPIKLSYGNLIDLYKKHGVKGDKKLILRTDVIKEFPPYPEFKNEKLVPLGILYLQIGSKYNFIYSNDVYCIVEYQEEGSSATILRQYKQSPKGFGYARLVEKKYHNSFLDNCKSSIHLISAALFAKDYSLLTKGNKVYLNFILLPFGLCLYYWIKSKTK